ncbi:MAG: hypothetical protein E5Y73_25660 [Mesorhizobium sp.]|uniref:hypothetical protein n=1 Tax=Mesorhizobium sp. TaxID=1871066 RepID=UPI0011FBAB91|nr:hypothetical protein [Mesorhizobium sp.]TIL87310.1 MAG: hypothetical protein E5Y73_25660 [Mesorhizobium sp.]
MQVVFSGLKFAATLHNRQNVQLFGAGWNWRLLIRPPSTGQLTSLPIYEQGFVRSREGSTSSSWRPSTNCQMLDDRRWRRRDHHDDLVQSVAQMAAPELQRRIDALAKGLAQPQHRPAALAALLP